MADSGEVDYAELRKQFLRGITADEVLFRALVLKGGNALALIYGIGERASLDLDFSLESDLADAAEFGSRLETALTNHLRKLDYHLFDWEFEPRPREATEDPTWGGYVGRFKLIEEETFQRLNGDIESARRRSIGVAPGGGSSRIFNLEVSRFEYCEATRELDLADGRPIRVYTLAALAAEKLRAICQQLPEYTKRRKPAPRARDFYDIRAVVGAGGFNPDSPAHRTLVDAVFAAKQVPLALLETVRNSKEFHEPGWQAVADVIPADILVDFDECFDFVIHLIERLKPLWMENTP